MPDLTDSERLLKVEFRLDQHDNRLTTLHTDFKTMNATLQTIEMTLRKIQWLATGAVLLGLIQYFGLHEVIKGLLRL